MHIILALVLKNITPIFFLPFSFTFLCLVSCTDDTPKTEPSAPVEKKIAPVAKTIIKKEKLDFPVVYVEELDQSQEFYKEQHETSFSFVREKNWFSYTPEKKGILTKILLLENQITSHLTIMVIQCKDLYVRQSEKVQNLVIGNFLEMIL